MKPSNERRLTQSGAVVSLVSLLIYVVVGTIAYIQHSKPMLSGSTTTMASSVPLTCPKCVCVCQIETKQMQLSTTTSTPHTDRPTETDATTRNRFEVEASKASPGSPEELKSTIRDLDLDGGKDFFGLIIHAPGQPRSQQLIVEIGTGDGRQASEVAQAGYRITTIDAFPDNLGRAKNWARGKGVFNNITFIHSAVSNYKGEALFVGIGGIGRLMDVNDSKIDKKWNNLHGSRKVTVPVNTLDDLVDESPFILKVDVEGNELKVLQGGEKVLSTLPSIIIMEFNPCMMNWSQSDDAYFVLQILHQRGYILYDSKITEPLHRGFLKDLGSSRPTGYREFVDWLLKSGQWDKWGSWTDIIAVLPGGTRKPNGEVWEGITVEHKGQSYFFG